MNEQQRKDWSISFVKTLQANVDNENLDDEEFREFVRNSLRCLDEPAPIGGEYVGGVNYGCGLKG